MGAGAAASHAKNVASDRGANKQSDRPQQHYFQKTVWHFQSSTMAIAGPLPPPPRAKHSRPPPPAVRGRAHEGDICRLALTVEFTADLRQRIQFDFLPRGGPPDPWGHKFDSLAA